MILGYLKQKGTKMKEECGIYPVSKKDNVRRSDSISIIFLKVYFKSH